MECMPEDFVHVHDIVPLAIQDIRFAGPLNFIGQPVPGYEKPVAIMTRDAAARLQEAFSEAEKQGCWIKIWDAYRPQSAVDRFVRWAKEKDADWSRETYYPRVPKNKLMNPAVNYIAEKSEHTRGSAMDITLVDRMTHQELDMGGPYLLFDERSHFDCSYIGREQRRNRDLLRGIMESHGFSYYEHEWWHYHLDAEPFPATYFDFPVR